MKKVSILVALFLLVVSFQNCGQKNFELSDDTNSSDQKSDQVSGGLIVRQPPVSDKLDLSKTESVVFLNDQNVSQISDVDSKGFVQAFQLSMKNGNVVEFDYENPNHKSSQTYCLTDTQLKSLQVILSQSQVCSSEDGPEKTESNQVCTMEYQYPYASLIGSNFSVKLGEKHSGCDEGDDLCGTNADLFKASLKDILSNLKNQKCQFVEL